MDLVTITPAHIEQAIDLHILNRISFWNPFRWNYRPDLGILNVDPNAQYTQYREVGQ